MLSSLDRCIRAMSEPMVSHDCIGFYLLSEAVSRHVKVVQSATVMLTDDPVKRVDNMTMAWGLEARVPFLDHELVEFSARIPAALKVGRGGKYVLKEAARSVIPAEVIDRPKGYFPVPALKYLDGDYLAFVSETG